MTFFFFFFGQCFCHRLFSEVLCVGDTDGFCIFPVLFWLGFSMFFFFFIQCWSSHQMALRLARLAAKPACSSSYPCTQFAHIGYTNAFQYLDYATIYRIKKRLHSLCNLFNFIFDQIVILFCKKFDIFFYVFECC